ncbi:MAG TPA: FKBP-type peptidyl-prolyl cis-trans isomerase [Thermoanaerobaculia bacterium]|jgi:peptidylprolyl isomerase|nr:FKBP-type peptidyl-prolyl cis-trans isomerase [Thermoanaerobaculia bacterium]
MRTFLAALALVALPLFANEKPAPPADLTSPPPDAERGDDGLITKKLSDGTGTEHPKTESLARVRYTVWKSDGSLVQHVPEPRSATIAVSKMLPGWGKAVQKMVVGEKQRSWIPFALAGDKLKEGESLIFDTELIEIVELPVAPPDVAAPPADATITKSGLAYKVLRPGTGNEYPNRRRKVVVQYTGWTPEGMQFDSSIERGLMAFGLDNVIAGWTEGLQLMVKGEKTRFWIPARLGYGSDRSKPQSMRGMLVFDIELIDIK